MAWSDPRTWTGGETPAASVWNAHIRDNFNWLGRAGEDGWASFTPTWTASGTAPAIGNGTLSGFYQHVGMLVVVTFHWVAGGTTTFGTGDYSFATPVAMNIHSLTYSGFGGAVFADTGTGERHGQVRVLGSTVQLYHTDTGSTVVGQTSPHTWADTDEIHASYVGESAG